MSRLHWVFMAMLLVAGETARAEGQDYSAGMALRNLPLGAALFGTLGYGRVLWGEQAPGKFDYGYLRGALRLQTSGVVNRGEALLSFHPISFFGVTVGHVASSRSSEFDWTDCELTVCRGALGTTYIKSRLLLGHGPFFFSASVRYSSLGVADPIQPFADEGSSLVGRAGGDRLASLEATMGMTILPDHALALHLERDRMIGSGSDNDHESLLYRYRTGDWTWLAGAGLYRSTTQGRGPSVYGGLQWTGLPSVELF